MKTRLILTIFLTLCLAHLAGAASDVRIVYQEIYGTFSTTFKKEVERCRSLIDERMVMANNLPAPDAVLTITIRSANAATLPPGWLGESGGGYFLWSFAKSRYVMAGSPYIKLNTAAANAWTPAVIQEVMFHEIMHALGWDAAQWQINKLLDAQGRYIGEHGLAAYRAAYDPDALFVPMTGSHLTETVNPLEEMTPIHTGNGVVGLITLGIMKDNGLTVNEKFVPRPLAALLPARRFMELLGD